MNTNDNGRDARSRANRRLRNLTIGTAVIGVVATGGLSTLAAVTYDGSGDTATAGVTTADTGTTTADTGTTSTAAASTTTPTATAAPVVTSAVAGTGHASTGGS